MKTLRLFVTSSHLSTGLMSYYANKTCSAEKYDIIIIDNYEKKRALLDLIHSVSIIHSWNNIIDLSVTLADEKNLKPSVLKKLTRQFKSWPIIRFFYNILLNIKKSKIRSFQKTTLKSAFKRYSVNYINFQQIELYLLTQTVINDALFSMFPNSKVYYMEHGLGDYIHIFKKPKIDGAVFIFADLYTKYLQSNNKSFFPVYNYIDAFDFKEIFLNYSEKIAKGLDELETHINKNCVLFLMDASECYSPPINFWTDYIDRCLKEIMNINDYTIIVKPHPLQSNEVMKITKEHFEKLKIDYIMLDSPLFTSLSVETIYVKNMDKIKFVFSTFSSALFYLAKFYGEKSKFYHLYYFVNPYFKNAPLQYKNAYIELEDLMKNVFISKNCIALK